MINRHLAHLWRQMKIHRIVTHVCLHQIGCLCYCCYAKTSSSAVQKSHSKVYGNPIAPSFYSILLVSPLDRLIHSYIYKYIFLLQIYLYTDIYIYITLRQITNRYKYIFLLDRLHTDINIYSSQIDYKQDEFFENVLQNLEGRTHKEMSMLGQVELYMGF